MKKILLLWACMALLMPAFPSTNVSGPITTNTIWNVTGSPYIVTSYVTVNSGVTLTVQSGVTVKLNDAQYMYVYGTMNATGATFTSNNASPTPGIWSFIQVGSVSPSYSGTVTLDNCQVLYANSFIMTKGKATLTTTDLLNFNSTCVDMQQSGCQFKMTGGNINTSSANAAANGYGIGGYTNSTDTLSGVTIQHFLYGIYLRQNAKIDLTNTTITSCSWPIWYNGSADLTLHGTNSFTGNTNSEVRLAFTSMSDTTVMPTIALPYVIPSGMNIVHNAWLTFQTGATIKIGGGQNLYIYGRFFATNATITSNNVSPSPGDWNMQIGSSTVSDSGWINLSSCQVQYQQQVYLYNGKASLTSTSLSSFLYHGVQMETRGILSMSGGTISTTSTWAASNGGAIVAYNGAHATLSSVTLQNCYYGIYLGNNAVVDITNVSITACKWPVFYTSSADLTVHGTNTFTGNVNTAVNMNFTSVSDTLVLPTLSIPFYFPSSMTINTGGRLVVSSANILKFQDYTYLDVNGTLVANANVAENIFFTSYKDDNWGGDTNNDGTATAPATGNWYGVRFQDASSDATCLMRRCKLRYAGAGNTGGISMFTASPTIDLCEISNCYYGFYMQYASNPVLSSNTIGSSQLTPIAMSFEANPTMTNNVLSFSDNAYDCIGLLGGTLTANAVIKKRNVTTVQNITYLMLDQIIVPAGKTLTINKGIVIKSYSYAHRIIVDGVLNAIATVDSMTTFTSSKDDNYGNPGDSNKDGTITSPVVGDWGGIIFDPGATGNLTYCRIKYATIWNYGFSTCSITEYILGAGVGMIDASPTIANCEFKDLNYGIACHRASNPAISNNSMININYSPFNISGSSNPTFTGNTFTNVKWQAIGLIGGRVCQNGTIKKRDVAGYTNITYVLLADMYINSGTYVNVEPGVVIKMNYCTFFMVDGGFKTDGTAGQKVVFTSLQDDNEGNPFDTNGDGNATVPSPGNWGTIKFNATSDDAYCNINHARVKYAGCNGYGAVSFENASGQVNNSTLTNSGAYGLYCNGNSAPAITSVIIQNCSSDPIAMSLLSNPVFTSITFTANGSQALKIIEGTLSSSATLAPRNVAGINNIAYVIDNLDISTNGRLVIQPGVVMKFRNDNGYNGAGIYVYGKLIANGLPANRIYFTSYHDDSKGGDSNNNGNGTSPTWGDWGYYGGGYGINFSNLINDTLTYCEIDYPSGGINFSNAHSLIDNCIIQQIGGYGINISGSSNPLINNCQFNTIQASPIRLSMFSSPSFSNNTCLNVGRMALTVIPETYSQSATIPVRSFGGYSNITYYLESVCTINSGTTINIPAGIVFKGTGTGFSVNGRLNVNGTSGSPVVFTDYRDDAVGNPPDMNQDGTATQPSNNSWSGTWIGFNDISNDSSTLNYLTLKYASTGIALSSASPTIGNTTFQSLHYGVDLNGVSQPKIDYCSFTNLRYYPIYVSLVSFPSSLTNNTISGSTWKVIRVRDETLTQDVTLPKRSFGGVSNIAYLFGNYTIGTGATLTISPGVVCKFQGGGIYVNKGLIAEGGFAPDSNIVFTDYRDDFYGGDSNSDTIRTTPARGYWNGLTFNDQSLDPLCRLQRCIIRYSNYGIYTTSASPQVTYCNIAENYYGVYATAASNPVFTSCDFDNNYYWAIDNVDKSFTINALNCWWGSNLGPIQTNIAGNGTSVQELITTAVNYSPYSTAGSTDPRMGDVSLNGIVQSYDASLVLQHVVGSIPLNATQHTVADVSGSAGVTSYDASLILQYVVGIIQTFPAELTAPVYASSGFAQLVVGSASVSGGDDVTIPLRVVHDSALQSADIRLVYDPALLQATGVENVLTGMSYSAAIDPQNGIITIGMAGTDALLTDTTMVLVTFHAIGIPGQTVVAPVQVQQFLADEADQTLNSVAGSITITDLSTGTGDPRQGAAFEAGPVHPNPASGTAILTFTVRGDRIPVKVELYSMQGTRITTLFDGPCLPGRYELAVNEKNDLDAGNYVLRITASGHSRTQILTITR